MCVQIWSSWKSNVFVACLFCSLCVDVAALLQTHTLSRSLCTTSPPRLYGERFSRRRNSVWWEMRHIFQWKCPFGVTCVRVKDGTMEELGPLFHICFIERSCHPQSTSQPHVGEEPTRHVWRIAAGSKQHRRPPQLPGTLLRQLNITCW